MMIEINKHYEQVDVASHGLARNRADTACTLSMVVFPTGKRVGEVSSNFTELSTASEDWSRVSTDGGGFCEN